MKTPPQKLVGPIRRAAEMRVAGNPFEIIAKSLQKQIVAIRSWPKKWPEYWRELVAEARTSSIESAADEARAVLRLHLRSKKDTASRDAAKQLIQHHAHAPTAALPAGSNELHHFVQLLQEMTDADLDALLDKCPVANEAGAASDPLDEKDSPSAD